VHWVAVIVLDAIVLALAGAMCWRAARRHNRRHAVGVANPIVHAVLASALALSIVVRTIAGALQ